MRQFFFYTCFFLFSCNMKKDKQNQETKNLDDQVDTILPVIPDSLRMYNFNITELIPELLQDSNYHSISGIRVGTDIQKTVIYNTYTLPRKKLFELLSRTNKDTMPAGKKQVQNIQGPVKIEKKSFFNSVHGTYENNPYGQRFYDKLSQLKGYDIYFVMTFGYLHWIFIDQNSDTVYHRSQLLSF